MVACCACEGGKSVASASSLGSLHIWRVEYAPRTSSAPEAYSGLTSEPSLHLHTHSYDFKCAWHGQ